MSTFFILCFTNLTSSIRVIYPINSTAKNNALKVRHQPRTGSEFSMWKRKLSNFEHTHTNTHWPPVIKLVIIKELLWERLATTMKGSEQKLWEVRGWQVSSRKQPKWMTNKAKKEQREKVTREKKYIDGSMRPRTLTVFLFLSRLVSIKQPTLAE